MARKASTPATKKTTKAKTTSPRAKSSKSAAMSCDEQEQAAYFHWLDRGAPAGDDQHDWFAVNK